MNGIVINDFNLSKIFLDKIYAISGETVCRRIKDELDIHVISFVIKIDTVEIRQIWTETGRELGILEHIKYRLLSSMKLMIK